MARWVCGSCGSDNPEGTRFCGQCGTPAATSWACSSCGSENPEGTRFCGQCGTPAGAAPPPPPAPEPTLEPSGALTETLRTLVSGAVADRLVEHGGQLPEERRLVTALFADVSGFTALSERLDPEELIEVIDPVVTALSRIVGRYEGYVSKYAGDALLALFGAPVAHEDDAARAVQVALEMHAELERVKQTLPVHGAELELHVGVNSGHAIARILGSEARMDYSVLGDSVNLAQRLESAAPSGETYVSETTVRLTEHQFEFERVGDLTLKGKAEPVPAWRLVGERTTAATPADELVGREPELAVVDEALAELDTGSGGVLVISGEPGIGKSHLTSEALARARTLGARILHARCVSYGAAVAYAPYVDLLRRYLDVRGAERRETLALTLEESNATESFPYFARLLGLPDVGDAVATLEPEAFRRGLHEAITRWIGNLADAAPLVLVIEDVHWSDPSSLDLTSELVRLAGERALLVFLVGRPEVHEKVAPIVDGARHRQLEIGPLDRAGIERLAEATLGAAAGKRLVTFIERRTNGNPFFVQELVRTLKESDALVHDAGGWRMRPGWDEQHLPPTIEGVLAARIDLLPRESAALLQTAAVVGRTVRVPLLASVVGDDALEPKLDALVGGGFFDRAQESGEPAVVFHHALLQDAAYARLLRRNRRELHLRVAEVAESLYGSGDQVIDLLARHLYLGESPKAPEYLMRAGERAKELYANDEAIVHLTRARELRADDPALALALAELYDLIGSYDDALVLFDELRLDGGGIEAWRGSAAVLRKQGEYERVLALLDEAFAAPKLADADLAPLWRESGLSLSLMGRLDQAREVLSTALEAVGERDDLIVGELLLELALTEDEMGRLDDALRHGLRGLEIFERDGTLHGLSTALRQVGMIYWDLGRLDEAAASLRRGLELAERVGAVEEVGGCLINLGRVECDRGALAEAVACDRRAIEEFERISHAGGRARGYANLANDLALMGSYDEALEWAERAIEFARSIGRVAAVADAIDTIANIEFERGRFGEAANRAEEAASLHVESGAAPSAAKALALAGRAWKALGDEERARAADARAREMTVTPAG